MSAMDPTMNGAAPMPTLSDGTVPVDPVLVTNPLTVLGVEEVLEVVVRGFPSPLEHPAPR